MKIALLLTGQLRTVDLVKYVHMNTLIKKYDTDVFLGIDLNNNLQCVNQNSKTNTDKIKAEEVVQFFKPKGTFILEKFDYEIRRLSQVYSSRTKDKKSKVPSNIEKFKILYEQYYIVNKTYEILIDYITKTNTKYDLIIRLRFDQFIWSGENYLLEQMERSINHDIYYNQKNIDTIKKISAGKKIEFDSIGENDIHVFGFGLFQNTTYNYANDQFFYHKQNIMQKIRRFYSCLMDEMIYCFENNIGNKGGLIESIWYNYLIKNEINMVKTNVKGLFVREFQSHQ